MNSTNVTILNSEILLSEVRNAVSVSKNQKAVGVDMIANEILKDENVVTMLCSFFNMCLRCQCIPDVWRKSIIQPIPKGSCGEFDPLKYRGLAVCTKYLAMS